MTRARAARASAVTAALLACALSVATYALATGDVPVPPADVLSALTGRADAGTAFVVLDLRLPRIATALLAGAALGAAGALTQRITRNPLGSPDMLGLSGGAGLGAAAVVVLVGGTPTTIALGALVGCLLAAAAVWLVGARGGLAAGNVVLAGIGVAALAQAGVGYLLTRARSEDAVAAQRWLIGSVAAADVSRIVPLAVAVAVLLPLALLAGRRLALLDLGDELAAGLGLPAPATRAALLGLAVLLVAAATSVTGPLVFVALLAPQVAARLAGLRAPSVATAAAFGAALVVASDLLAQRLIPDVVLPVGVVTAAVGGCYLAVLLARREETPR
ncbi:MAG: iron chelate uptake ABC transporter family permease subunit [Kineosporiaceae bacterium]